jgi:hypothetical protein
MFEDNIIPFNGIKLEDLVYISDNRKNLKLGKRYKFSRNHIYNSCINYEGNDDSIEMIKLRCLIFAIINLYSLNDYDELIFILKLVNIFDHNDKFLDDAWNLALEHRLIFKPLGDAIRLLGYESEYDYQIVNIKSARKV